MPDLFYKMIFFSFINALMFGSVYLYGRKAFPKKAARLTLYSWIVLTTLSYFSGALSLMLSLVLMIVYLRLLRKPNDSAALQQFYLDNKIYSTTVYSEAVLELLGNKNWVYAEGVIEQPRVGNAITYGFWQGFTTSYVVTSKYSHTTAYTHYLAFVFPPRSVGPVFKQAAMEAADKSTYTVKQKIRFFFVPDMEKPCLVASAKDGSFVIQYITIPGTEHYSGRLSWIKKAMAGPFLSIAHLSVSKN